MSTRRLRNNIKESARKAKFWTNVYGVCEKHPDNHICQKIKPIADEKSKQHLIYLASSNLAYINYLMNK